jgi:hypothetical protein
MAAITWAQVVSLDAALAAVDSTIGDLWAALANEKVNVSNFGGESSVTTQMARMLYAAHLATYGTVVGTAGGPITSESLGDEARSYGATAASDMSGTGFGRAFGALVKSSPARAGWVVGMPYS